MFKLLSYLLNQGVATATTVCPDLAEGVRGLPRFTDVSCQSGCSSCVDVCPTNAISLFKVDDNSQVTLDLGVCIGCGYCVDVCPTGTIKNNPSTRIAVRTRKELIISTGGASNTNTSNLAPVSSVGVLNTPVATADVLDGAYWFGRSIAARVVSTGCSACDLELGAAGNPIFDMERFGVHIVASPRFADALIVTGPVSKGMHEALKSCYEAMSTPRVVIALGSCAVSGGVHRGGYAEANGLDHLLPVNAYIPGCPPHPWSIIHGLLLVMGKA